MATRISGLRALLSEVVTAPQPDEPIAISELNRSNARGWLTLGRLQLDARQFPDAVQSLERATRGLTGSSVAAERAIAFALLGCASIALTPQDSIDSLARGVRELESVRGQLAAQQHRGQLIERYGDVYSRVFDTLMSLQYRAKEASMLSAELAESLRRGALAQMLRSRRLADAPNLQRLRDRIAYLETRNLEAGDRELAAARQQLGQELSRLFATTYLPAEVDYPKLRSRASASHILTYFIALETADRLTGHVVWTPETGAPIASRFDIRDPALLAILGLSGRTARNRAMSEQQTPEQRQLWHRLCRDLIPGQFRTILTNHETDAPANVVVVPDQALAALPWAALRLDDGRALVQVAVLQFSPSLELLGADDTAPWPSKSGSPTPTVAVHLGLGGAPTGPERTLTEQSSTREAATRDEFLASLDDVRPVGCYLAVHGAQSGLDQQILFGDSSTLSAATALTTHWPSWVVFASCLVGHVSIRPGWEPLGLPISCLLGGARTVIGGVIEAANHRTGELAVGLVRRLLAGEHPARALRAEQLTLLNARTQAPRPYVWAALVCISLEPPQRSTDIDHVECD